MLIWYYKYLRKLNNAVKSAKSYNKKGALLYIDLDNYKDIISNHGFDFGGEVIKKFAKLIIPLMDKNYELAKMPGKSFAILIDSFNDLMEVKEVCDKIHDICKEGFYIEHTKVNISVSIGATIFPDDSSDAEELLKFSDFALRQSRISGGGTCTRFNKELSEFYYRQILIEDKLSDAIRNKEMYLYYQPQVDVERNKIIGLESLLRWNNRELGNVSPGEFIPIAEQKGYIIEIGNWVLEESLKTFNSWQQKGFDLETISINISSIEISRKNFRDNLVNLCKKYNVPHSKVKLEITERTLMINSEDNKKKIDGLIIDGFKIASEQEVEILLEGN